MQDFLWVSLHICKSLSRAPCIRDDRQVVSEKRPMKETYIYEKRPMTDYMWVSFHICRSLSRAPCIRGDRQVVNSSSYVI